METLAIPKAKMCNGVNYYDLLVSPTTSHLTTATINDKEKLVFNDSTFAIGLVTNSYKYGSEVQFISYSRRAPVLERRVDKDHEYYRLECGYLLGSHETAEKLRNVADQLDLIIGYTAPTVSYSKPKRIFNEKSHLEDILI